MQILAPLLPNSVCHKASLGLSLFCFVLFLSIEWRQQTLYSKVIVRRTRCAHKWDSGSLMIITKHLRLGSSFIIVKVHLSSELQKPFQLEPGQGGRATGSPLSRQERRDLRGPSCCSNHTASMIATFRSPLAETEGLCT